MPVSLSFAGESLAPLPCGALHWPAQGALFVADLHFEKASSFALQGRLLPPYDSIDTLAALIAALEVTRATRVVCLGDSFHDAGGPGRLPARARAALKLLTGSLDWLWISGNHDEEVAASLGGRVMAEARIGPLELRHEAVPGDPGFELSGHFHPKVTVHARGRRISRRCFAATQTKLVLPAYGSLTGGLDIGDPAFCAAIGRPRTALFAEGERLLRFPVAVRAAA